MKTPTHIDDYLRVGEEMLRSDDPEAALAAYEEALDLDPDDREALQGKAEALVRLGRLEQGMPLFMKVLESGDSLKAHSYLGKAFLELGRPEKAREFLEKAWSMDPDRLNAALDLASCRLLLGDFREAAKIYLHVLDRDPGSFDSMLGLAQTRLALGEFDKALAYADEAVEAAPSDPQAWFVKAQALRFRDELEEARLAADHAVALDPEDGHAWSLAADVLKDTGKDLLAGLYSARAKNTGTEKGKAAGPSGARGLGPVEGEIEELDAALLDHPKYTHAYHDRAVIHDALGFPERSLAFIDSLIAMWPEKIGDSILAERGIVLLKMGHGEEAAVCFRDALEFNPENAIAREALADILSLVEEERPGPPSPSAAEPERKFCAGCGSPVKAAARYCTGCGRPVNKGR